EARVGRVHPARVGEVLPDQEPELAAGVVEGAALDDAAPPDAHAVDPARDQPLQIRPELRVAGARVEKIHRDPVLAADEQRLAVHDQAEGGCGARSEIEGDAADADAPLEHVDDPAVSPDTELPRVQMRGASLAGVPAPRGGQGA